MSGCKTRNRASHCGIKCSATVMLAAMFNFADRSELSPAATSSNFSMSASTARAQWAMTVPWAVSFEPFGPRSMSGRADMS